MSDIDAAGLALANIWKQQREGALTVAEAGALIADQLRNSLPAQLLQLEKAQQVMAHLTNTIISNGPPEPTTGAPNAVAFDIVNGAFYGAKDAITGWPDPLPLFGTDGVDGAPGPDTATALNLSYAIGHGVKYAFETNADVVAFGLANGETAVSYGNLDPANNVKFEMVGGVLYDTLPLFECRYVQERGTVSGATQTAGGVEIWNAVWDGGSPDDPPVLDGLRLNIETRNTLGAKHHNSGSRIFRARMDGVDRFYFTDSAVLGLASRDNVSKGGLKMVGAATMGVWVGDDAGAGAEAEVFRVGWEDAAHQGTTDPASAAVIKGLGANRLSIESLGTLVHISANSRMEWESYGASRISWVGYQAGSSIGRGIDFNDTGQPGEKAGFIASISSAHHQDLLLLGRVGEGEDEDAGEWTTYSRFDGYGRWGFGVADPVAAVDVGLGGIHHTPRTVAQLAADFPAPVAGLKAFVSNSSVAHAGNGGTVVAGGGAHEVPVYYGSGAWRIG